MLKDSLTSVLSVAAAGLVEGKVGAEERTQYRPPEHRHRVGPDQLPHERHAGVLQHTHHLGAHQVQVLLAHLRHLVLDLARVVLHNERRLALVRQLVERVVLVQQVELL